MPKDKETPATKADIDLRFKSLRSDIMALQSELFSDFLSVQQDKLGGFDSRISQLEQQVSPGIA
jgi:hypothetical protein